MHLLRGLHDAGAEIVAIVVAGRPTTKLLTLPFSVELIVVDDPAKIGEGIRQAAAPLVIHLNAHVSTERSMQALQLSVQWNLLSTISLLTACAEIGTKRVVLMGSCEEYGKEIHPFDPTLAADPSSPYGASKAAITAYARMFTTSFHLPTVVLRPSVVYGPEQSPRMLISQVMLALALGRTIDVTEGKQTRDFVYVSDVVDAILLSLVTPGIEGEVLNAGSNEIVTVRECLERIEAISGRTGLIEYGKRPYVDREIFHYELINEPTYKALSWRPAVSLDEGLRRTWESMRRKI